MHACILLEMVNEPDQLVHHLQQKDPRHVIGQLVQELEICGQAHLRQTCANRFAGASVSNEHFQVLRFENITCMC